MAWIVPGPAQALGNCPRVSVFVRPVRISAQIGRRRMMRTMRDLKNCKKRAGARTRTGAGMRPANYIVTFSRRTDGNSGRNHLVTLCQFVSMFAKARCALRNRQRTNELRCEPQWRSGGKGDKKTLSQSIGPVGDPFPMATECTSGFPARPSLMLIWKSCRTATCPVSSVLWTHARAIPTLSRSVSVFHN